MTDELPAGPERATSYFGAELRHWRLVRGLSQAQLGRRTHHSESLISKIEKGQRRPSQAFARRMDEALETGGLLERLRPAEPDAEADPAMPVDLDLGLRWADAGIEAIAAATGLWRADMQRRTVLAGAAWTAAALAVPARRWLEDPADSDLSHRGPRRVGQADVAVMATMAATFSDLDRQRGGGYARTTLLAFLDQVVGPLLEGTYDDRTGRDLYSATARLTDLAGFMCFDSDRHGLGQRYFIQALRLAKAAGDQALGGHILSDMAMQAHHLGRGRDAAALAEAGVRSARAGGSALTGARCAAIQARAHAATGDTAAATAAMTVADEHLERADPDDEPSWIQFFDHRQLTVEFEYIAHELGHAAEVQRYAAQAPAGRAGEMTRRHVLGSATLAASYLPSERTSRPLAQVDIDQACAVLTAALPAAGGLASHRAREAVNGVRRQLAPFADHAAVQQLEADYQTLVAAPADT